MFADAETSAAWAPTRKAKVLDWLHGKLPAILFSILIPIIPIVIVTASPPRLGGIFVFGYLVGTVTAPIVLLGTLKAAGELFGYNSMNGVLGVVAYLTGVFLLSALAAVWSLFFAV